MAGVTLFGEHQGLPVYQYTVENADGAILSCLSLGAIWYRWQVPVGGSARELLLRSPAISDYVDDFSHHSQTIGRMAGRIPTTFMLDGKMVTVDANDGPVNLHGGHNGFYTLNWHGRVDGNSIIFLRTITPADDGFPGKLWVTIRYTLTDEDGVIIDYEATSDTVSLFNPMNHAYFNLNSENDPVRNHKLWLNSDKRFVLEDSKLPRPQLVSTIGTAYDFSRAKMIGDAIERLQGVPEHGIDDIYYVSDVTLGSPTATLSVADIAVDFYSDRNAIVVYSANNWQGLPRLVDQTAENQAGIAIELQTAPSALQDSRFGSLLIRSGQPVHYQSQYRLRRA